MSMALKLLVSLLCSVPLLVRDANSLEQEPLIDGENIKFQPLPKGFPYKTQAPQTEWILSSYEEIARTFVHALKSEPPYAVLKEIIKEHQFTSRASDEAFKYELPFLALASLSLLGFIIIPLTGLIFFCCRCFGRCGGKLEEEDMEFSPVKQRQRLSVAITLCSVFILIGSSCIFLSSDRLGANIPILNTVLQDSIDDIITYKNNTVEQLEIVVVDNMKFTSSLVEEDLNSISLHVAEPVMVEARKLVRPLLGSISEYENSIVVVKSLLDNVNTTVNELQELGTTLRIQLNQTRENLTEVRKSCNVDPNAVAAGVCDKIPKGDELKPVADFTKVPDVSQKLTKVKGVITLDIALEAKKGNDSFEKIPDDITNITSAGRKDIVSTVKDLQDTLGSVVSNLKNSSDQMTSNILLPLKSKIKSYLGPNGVVMEYDVYRFLGLLSLACSILFVTLLTYCGLSAGVFGARDYDTPSTRSLLADCGGKTLMCSAAFFFFLSLFINLLLGILFLFGANVTVICAATEDLKIIEKTFDDPSVHDDQFPLAMAFLDDGSVDLRISNVLRGCGKEETIWRLLKMDHRFDLENMTSYKDTWLSNETLLEAINKAVPTSFKIPPMDEIFDRLNATVTNVSIVTKELDKNLNDSLEADVHSIDFYKFDEQIALPLVAVSVSKFSSNLSMLSSQARPSSEAIADNLAFLSSRLEEIQEDTIDTSLTLVSILKAKVIKLEEKANETLQSINAVFTNVKKIDKFLQNDAILLANKASKKYIDRILNWIDQYLKDATYKVRDRVGECSAIKKAYDASTVAFCQNFLSPVNSLWLSLGTIAVFSVISIILCVHLAKHYRRAERSSRQSKAASYGVPLALFTSNMPNRRTTVNPWRRVNKNTPVPNVVDRMRWV